MAGVRNSVLGRGTSPFGSQTAAELGHSVLKKSFAARMEDATRGSTGNPFSRVADRGLQNVGEPPRAVVAQHQHPGVERAGHDARQHPGAGHLLEAEPAKRSSVAAAG